MNAIGSHSIISPRLSSISRASEASLLPNSGHPLIPNSPRLPPIQAVSSAFSLPPLPNDLVNKSPRLPSIPSVTPTDACPVRDNQSEDVSNGINTSKQSKTRIKDVQQYAMPIILLNMAGELVYILERRLQDQGAEMSAMQLVLSELIRAMMTDNLLQPRPLLSYDETVQIFVSMLESTPMVIPKLSMDALFEIIIAIFKHQILSCHTPEQYLIVTGNHLESIRKLVTVSDIDDMAKKLMAKVLEIYNPMTHGEWMGIKTFIFKYLENHKMKPVEILLKSHHQHPNAHLILDNGGKMASGCEIPGIIKSFENGIVVRTKVFNTPLSQTCISHDTHTVWDEESMLGMNVWHNVLPQADSKKKSITKRMSVQHSHHGAHSPAARKRLDSLMMKSHHA